VHLVAVLFLHRAGKDYYELREAGPAPGVLAMPWLYVYTEGPQGRTYQLRYLRQTAFTCAWKLRPIPEGNPLRAAIDRAIEQAKAHQG
jgi:hypothetical protein